MKFFFNTLVIIFFSLFIVSCSSIGDWDVSKIIDKTENWLFNEEDNFAEKEVEPNEFNEKGEVEENVQTEEVFPDISSVSQVKPDFEEIDENFFEGEPKENENIKTDTETDSKVIQTNKIDNLLIGKNISAVLELRQNVRFKLAKMLLESDPPVDKQTPVADKYISDIKITKVAIIQFPENAIIPDNSADKVLDEIIKFKETNKLRLVGHASKTGSETTQGKRINMEISISRAQTIKNMLIDKGFDAKNIEVLGKGDLEPLQEEVAEFGEAVNRRVEVFFISN